MGLDITAYRKLTLTPGADPDDYEHFVEISDSIIKWSDETFETPRSTGIAAGVYAFENPFEFRAGSYSGYNEFRDALSKLMRGMPASELWALPVAEQQGPFFELIHFADNEGVIGPLVAAKLAKDFADHQAKADAFSEPENWSGFFARSYAAWRKAFEMAADGGCVVFH